VFATLPVPSGRARFVFAGVLGLCLALRLWTIGSGVPYVVGVDEPEIVRRALAMMKSGDFNPHFFDYGGLIIYFPLAVATVRFAAGAMSGSPGFAAVDRAWDGDFYLWSSYATAVVGTLLIYVVYRVALRWGVRAAIAAAFVAAIHPGLVRESHFALTDTPLTFLIALTLLMAVIASENGRVGWFLAAGAAAGLAAAVKYNGALALVMPLAVALASPAVRERVLAMLAIAGGAAAAFLIGAPYSLLDLPAFLNAFARLATSYNHPADASVVAGVYIAHLRNAFGFGVPWSHFLGWGALAVSLAGFAIMLGQLIKRERRAIALAILAFSSCYFWLVAHQSLVYGRYLLPLIPFISLALGLAFARITETVAAAANPLRVRQTAAVLCLLALPPLWQAAQFDWNRRRTGTDEIMARWIARHVPPDGAVVLETAAFILPLEFHWDYTPRLVLQSADQYRQAGVKYLVSSSEKFDPARPPRPDDAAYRRLFSESQILFVVPYTRDHPGPTLTLLKLATEPPDSSSPLHP
jgi:4-amino-4-deoxy-L-arabinose transferase-like glycosyltransferase